MSGVLVTVTGSGARIDVSLPTTVRVGEIVPVLVGRCEPEAAPWSRWALGPPGGPAFSPRSTLAELGVVDGAELQLRDMAVSGDGRVAVAAAGTAGIATEPEQRRRSISDLTERLIQDIARVRAGRNPLLEYAAPEARRQLRALAPGPLDRAPESGYADVSLAVTWPRDPEAPVEVLATCSEVAAGGGARPDPGSSRGPVPAAATLRRMMVRMKVDPRCEHLLEVSVATAIAPPGARP